ncbi:MAG TPA: hypothetical protein VNN18_03530 [Candidatus Xenobia bacterium]|nr:hypothetical protein [Candidatus Xenobia bacterium]
MSVPDTYATVAFHEPGRAAANLQHLRARLPEHLLALLPTILGQLPDPDGSLNYLERFTREPPQRVLDALARQPALLHYLLALFSYSRFLSETLVQEPELILWLGRERFLERMPSKEELLEDYARFEATALELDPALALARFKRRQYLRIVLKDILRHSSLVETTLELSTLADALLEKALTRAQAELRPRYGAPETCDAQGRLVPARFAVVSLGKLGGNELNYSSDIDLLFLFAGEGATSGPERIANSEYFIRLAQRLLRIVAGVTHVGPVFRVDLRLRPGGGEGDLAISLPAALDYYQRRAREWELQMLLKARASAGDAALVREFLNGVEPFLYRGAMHFAAVEAVVQSREGMDRKLDAAAAHRVNVKLAPGGIRDIEFLVQCLQRLHGRDDPWVRAAGTLVGLQKLFEKGYLAGRDHHELATAYQFLRMVEHRLQLEHGQQAHTLPDDSRALELLARRCHVPAGSGREALDVLRESIEGHLRRVRAIYDRRLPSSRPSSGAEGFALRALNPVVAAGELSYSEILDGLRAQDAPLYHELAKLEVPSRATKAVQRFLVSALQSSTVFEEVNHAAAALPDGIRLLHLSEPLAGLLLRQPERLTQLLALRAGAAESSAAQLEIPLAGPEPSAWPRGLAAVVEQRGSLNEQMAGLRRYFTDAVFLWGAGEVCRQKDIESGLRAYSELADQVLRAGLAVASQHERATPDFAVVALGRLGTTEMDWGSDADLVFVARDAAQQEPLRRLLERFLHVVSGYTREGTIFPIDVRLRPRGGEGELVQTADSVLEYFRNTAAVWEAATYLKARMVASAGDFAREWTEQLPEALRERCASWNDIRGELRAMRKRLEEEAGAGSAENFKTGPGGVYDIDFILSAFALRAGARSQAGRSWAQQIEVLRDEGALTDGDAERLAQAAKWLRALDHAIRLATGRSSPQLPTGPRLEIVAELAGPWVGETLSGSTLVARLAEQRRAARAVFQQVFG